MNRKQIIMVIACFLVLASCKDRYIPEINDLDKEILVVEGFIEGGNQTIISLSRVKSMGAPDSTYEKYVIDASVHIEDDNGNLYPLWNYGGGNYAGVYNLNPNNQYRVKILMSNQKEYASQFVPYKVSPPISSITYRMEPKGARFLVSTGDVTGRSKYYRWKYEETWQFHSYYPSNYQYDRYTNAVIDIKDSVYNCWQSDQSTAILINNTVKLSEDVMDDMPLLLIPNGSYKLSYLYSIKVKQYVMDSVGYDYYRQLKKNTEETGSIFDPQPGNLKGNIMNVNDPLEMVVGYIGAGSSTERREFFRVPWNFREYCFDMIQVPNTKDSLDYYFNTGGYWPLSPNFGEGGHIENWNAATKICVDCRYRGTNVKPAFWP